LKIKLRLLRLLVVVLEEQARTFRATEHQVLSPEKLWLEPMVATVLTSTVTVAAAELVAVELLVELPQQVEGTDQEVDLLLDPELLSFLPVER
jgi:hypothetical protein